MMAARIAVRQLPTVLYDFRADLHVPITLGVQICDFLSMPLTAATNQQ